MYGTINRPLQERLLKFLQKYALARYRLHRHIAELVAGCDYGHELYGQVRAVFAEGFLNQARLDHCQLAFPGPDFKMPAQCHALLKMPVKPFVPVPAYSPAAAEGD